MVQPVAHVYLSNRGAGFRKETQFSNISSGLVWHVNLCFRILFFSRCVWCGVRCAALTMASATKHRCQKKRRGARHGNLLRALLNKVFKYYPKLKDIHACLKSSPPLSFSFSLPFSLFLSTVAGVGWFPWLLSV